ncbi:hypothetical protein IWQ56_001919, partial [Coemansia nantahalensis]
SLCRISSFNLAYEALAINELRRCTTKEIELPPGHRLRDAAQRFRVEYSTEDDPECPARLVIVVPVLLAERVRQFVHEAYGHARGHRFISLQCQCWCFPSMVTRA